MPILPPRVPFLGASQVITPGCPGLLGIPYDKTASFRKGTRKGPDGIREISEEGIETYSPTQDRDLEEIPFSDLGNLEIDNDAAPEAMFEVVYEAVTKMHDEGVIPVLLGGEHSISPGAVRAAFEHYPDLVVIQFDAHADLRAHYKGSAHSHACAMRRILDFLPSERLLQVGVRSGTREEYREMKSEDRYVAPDAEALASVLDSRSFRDAPLYITFDIDAFDPAEVPGTGTPEAGGITWADFESLRSVLEGTRIVGLDLVELAPELDPTGISSVLAAKLLREWLLTISIDSHSSHSKGSV